MEKDKINGLLIDYIDGLLTGADREAVEAELETRTEVRLRYEQLKEVMGVLDSLRPMEPAEGIEIKFRQYLTGEALKTERRIPLTHAIYRLAAAIALVITGIGIGYWISHQQAHEAELLTLNQKIEQTRALVMDKLGDKQSASQRLVGVNAAYRSDAADAAIIHALIRVMNEDPNSNVRLSAVEALGRFNEEPGVRTALISSLSIQTDPVVQIALIHLMVEIKETGAMKSLEQITHDEDVLPAVRDEAYAGIIKLS